MTGLREYILCVVSAAMLCGIVTAMTGKQEGTAQVMKLLCGLFLTLTVIRPLAEVKLEDFAVYSMDLQAQAMAASDWGQEIHDTLLESHIIESTESYILDEAGKLSLNLEVSVSLDEDHIPEEVVLKGEWEDGQKKMMQEILSSRLGIPKERQIWIG